MIDQPAEAGEREIDLRQSDAGRRPAQALMHLDHVVDAPHAVPGEATQELTLEPYRRIRLAAQPFLLLGQRAGSRIDVSRRSHRQDL